MRISIIQMDIELGKPKNNYKHAIDLMTKAMDDAPDVIILPEMFSTAYAFDVMDKVGDREGKELLKSFIPFIKSTHVNVIAGSVSDFRAGGLYNTTYVFDRSGNVILNYDKLHLFGLMEEDKFLQSGDKIGYFEIDGSPSGVMICYDLRFPELARSLALKGAKVLFIPAEWPHPRLDHWRTLQIARAIENQMYVVSCNRVGEKGRDKFFGHSMVIDPWGEVKAETGEDEDIVTVNIDLGMVNDVRKKMPVFKDRRPDVYSL
jgi:predicted amidohydrolase